jgi:hypothetical protein
MKRSRGRDSHSARLRGRRPSRGPAWQGVKEAERRGRGRSGGLAELSRRGGGSRPGTGKKEHGPRSTGNSSAGQQEGRRESGAGNLDLAGAEAGEAQGGRSGRRRRARAHRLHGRERQSNLLHIACIHIANKYLMLLTNHHLKIKIQIPKYNITGTN